MFGPADVSCNTPRWYLYASVDIDLASALFLLQLFMRTHTVDESTVAQGALAEVYLLLSTGLNFISHMVAKLQFFSVVGVAAGGGKLSHLFSQL